MFKKLVVAALLFAPSVATATPPNPPPQPLPNCAFTGWNTTFNWGFGVTALQCFGAVDGNNRGSASPGAAGTITLLETAFDLNGATTTANGWAVLGTPTFNTSAGTITFSQYVSGKFAVALKQSNQFSLYLLQASGPINQINYTTAGVQRGATTGLSHADLYTVAGVTVTCTTPAGCNPPVTTVPEPSTYALMAAGLMAVVGVARRRRTAQG